jgi:hypothetical protein
MQATPKDFFLWLGAIITLYASTGALITLLFQYINYAFPDPLETYYIEPYSGPMRFAMASLIVLVPVCLYLMRVIRRDIDRDHGKSELWVRRWALVLTVFLAAAIVVGDLITLVNYFLGGDLTTRFLMKVGVVLLVAGGLFLHFLADIRGYWIKEPARARLVGLGAAAAVVCSIAAGFFIMGSPAQVRLYRFDEQKIMELQNIQWQIVEYYRSKQMLPASLAALEDPISGFKAPVDPQSGASYGYEVTGDNSFWLCAEFNMVSTRIDAKVARPIVIGGEENWQHGTGKECFKREIDPERYPPYEKIAPVPAPMR